MKIHACRNAGDAGRALALAILVLVFSGGCGDAVQECHPANCTVSLDTTFQICVVGGSTIAIEKFGEQSCQFDTANPKSAASAACQQSVAAWCSSMIGGSAGGAGGGSAGGAGGAGGGSGGGTVTAISCSAPDSFNTSNGGSCGSWRWPVKTGQDAAVAAVLRQTPTPIDIKTLGSFPVPAGLGSSLPRTAQENTLYILRNVIVMETKLESDSDYHMPLKDPVTGATLEAEIAFPPCAKTTSLTYCFDTHSRHTLEALLTPTGSYQPINQTATIIGPALFDMLHGSTSAAPNGIEIHPVLALCFGLDCNPLAN